MEGFGLAYPVMRQGLPFLEVRTISNVVGSREAEDWNLKGAFKQLKVATDVLFTGEMAACLAPSQPDIV